MLAVLCGVRALQNVNFSLVVPPSSPLGPVLLSVTLTDDVGNAFVYNVTSVVMTTSATLDLPAAVVASQLGLRTHNGSKFLVEVGCVRMYVVHHYLAGRMVSSWHPFGHRSRLLTVASQLRRAACLRS